MANNNSITIMNARLLFKNFAGKRTDYNNEGSRNFCVVLDEELAAVLKDEGFNVKRTKPYKDDPEDNGSPYLKVNVNYHGKFPPIVVMIVMGKDGEARKINLNEETINQLDWTRIEKADLIINPHPYPERVGRPAGISAYLKSLYVTIIQDELEQLYDNIPYVNE